MTSINNPISEEEILRLIQMGKHALLLLGTEIASADTRPKRDWAYARTMAILGTINTLAAIYGDSAEAVVLTDPEGNQHSTTAHLGLDLIGSWMATPFISKFVLPTG